MAEKSRHPVTMTMDDDIYAQLNALVERYNIGRTPKLFPGDVAGVAIRALVELYPFVRQQQLIDKRDDPQFWATLRTHLRRQGPSEWPGDYEGGPEIPGNQ